MSGGPRRIELALLLLLQLAAVELSRQASNVPFKTSFVSSSDYPVRRNGALISLPLANAESRHQPDASGANFDPIGEDQSYVLSQLAGSYGSFREEPNAVASLHQTEAQAQEQSHDQRAETHVEDLIAASSGETRAGVESDAPNKTARTTTTTSTTLPPSTSAPTQTPAASSSSAPTTESSGSDNQTTTTTTGVPTSTPATQTSTTTVASTSTTATATAQANSSSPAAPTSTTHNSTSTEKPLKPASETPTTTSGSGAPDNRQSDSAAGPTPRSTIAENRRPQVAVTQTPGDEAERLTTKSLELFASNRSSGARSSLCQFGEQNCGKFFVATVPVIDEKANTTRVVSEYVFLPEDSTLNFDQSAYSTTRKPNEPEVNLMAEHRTIDSDGDMSAPLEEDLELDYASGADVDSRTSADQPSSRTQATSATQAPDSQRLGQISTTKSTLRAGDHQSTTTTTARPAQQPQVRTSQSTSYSVRVTSSPSSSVRRPAERQPSGSSPSSATSVTSTSASTSISTSSSRPTTSRPTISSSTTTTPTTRRSTSARPNQKLMRVAEPEPSVAPITSSTRRPSDSARRDTPTRRAKSFAETHQHRPFFSEPTSDLRRRPGTQFSPLANGADEEEANILTRYAIPSQLTRLSASGVPVKAEDSGRRRSANARQAQQQQQQQVAGDQLRRSIEPTASRTIAELRVESERQATRAASSTQPTVKEQTTTTTAASSSTTSSTTTTERSVANLTQLQPAPIQTKPTDSAQTVHSSTVIVLDANEPTRNPRESLPAAGELDVSRQAPNRQRLSLAGDTATRATVAKVFDRPTGQAPSVRSNLEAASRQGEREVLTLISSSAPGQAKVGPPAKSEANRAAAPVARTPPRVQPALDDSSEAKLRRLIDELEASAGLDEQLARDSAGPAANRQPIARRPTSYVAARQQQQVARADRKPAAPVDDGKWQPSAGEDSGAANGGEEGNSAQSSMPGRPGVDYPVHWQVPKTTFDCRNYELSGFYADVESDCQAYHSCHKGRGGRHTFLCPNGTLFSQELLTCDWWYNVECSASKLYLAPAGAATGGGLNELSMA